MKCPNTDAMCFNPACDKGCCRQVSKCPQCGGSQGHMYNCPALKEGPQKPNALSVQVGGDHYKKMAIQPVEYCHRNKLGPCESAIVKYATRWREKGGIQDLRKIQHYVDLLIELEGLAEPTMKVGDVMERLTPGDYRTLKP